MRSEREAAALSSRAWWDIWILFWVHGKLLEDVHRRWHDCCVTGCSVRCELRIVQEKKQGTSSEAFEKSKCGVMRPEPEGGSAGTTDVSGCRANTVPLAHLVTDSLEGTLDSPGGASGEEPACQCRRHKRCGLGSIPGSEDPPEGGMATHSIILAWRIPTDRGAWRATVRRVTKSRTRLKRLSMQGSRDRRHQHIRLMPSQQDSVHPLHFLSTSSLLSLHHL